MATESASDVRPFRVDPLVMSRIRRLDPEDLAVVVPMHAGGMGTSLWGRLGTPFLEALYGALLRRPELRAFAYEEDGRVRGFLVGTTDASALLRGTARAEGHRLAIPALRGLARTPGLFVPLLATPFYFRRSDPAGEVPAESLFCAVEPALRGSRVAGHLNKVLFDGLAAEGLPAVKITTEADNVAACRQLRSWGFRERGTFAFYGTRMVTWVLDLDASPRVERRRWVA